MNLLLATDSFKDSLSALDVSNAIKEGILSASPSTRIRIIPLADGGEGTVESMVNATEGTLLTKTVFNPLMQEHKAFYGILGDEKTAVIEMASASGIELLKPEERNAWITTTYGTGQLILAALDKGCKKIIVGLGGSATNDGGAGMAQALGYFLSDINGNPIAKGGGALASLEKIDSSTLDQRIKDCEIIVACDVNNPLTGPTGASRVYGPQKGANHEMVEKLDANLGHFSKIIQRDLGNDIEKIPGSGAAGGLGAGLMAFAGAELKPGFDIIRDITGLEEHIQWADVIITGEGKIDEQTKFGKTPMGVAYTAAKYKKPVIAVAGTLGQGYEKLLSDGFSSIFSIVDKPMSLEDALTNASDLLKNFGCNLIRTLNL